MKKRKSPSEKLNSRIAFLKANVGKRIREYRKKRKLTQKELGKLIGSDGRRISLYERGEVYPSANVLVNLADSLEISIDELLRESLPHNNFSSEDIELLKMIKGLSPEGKNTIKILLEFVTNNNRVSSSL